MKVINHRCACEARVTVLGLCVCVCVCLSITAFLPPMLQGGHGLSSTWAMRAFFLELFC